MTGLRRILAAAGPRPGRRGSAQTPPRPLHGGIQGLHNSYLCRFDQGPDLTIRQILQWAEAHHRRAGRWPSQMSGPVRGVAGERWGNIQSALYKGSRGLPGGSSLAKLLDQRFGS